MFSRTPPRTRAQPTAPSDREQLDNMARESPTDSTDAPIRLKIRFTREKDHRDVSVFEFRRSFTVRDVKSMIQERTQIPVSEQVLKSSSYELSDSNDFNFYFYVRNNTVLDLYRRRALSITVKLMGDFGRGNQNGTNLELHVDTNDTVESLKTRIHHRSGAPAEKLVLTLQDQTLKKDDQALEFYNVEDKATICAYLGQIPRPKKWSKVETEMFEYVSSPAFLTDGETSKPE